MKKTLFKNLVILVMMLCFTLSITAVLYKPCMAQTPASKTKDIQMKKEQLKKQLQQLDAEEKSIKENKPAPADEAVIKETETTVVESPEYNYSEEKENTDKTGTDKGVKYISRDYVKVGETITIHKNEVLTGSTVLVGSTLNLDGEISGDIVAVASTINMGPDTRITGDGVLVLSRVNKAEGAEITGDVINVLSGGAGYIPKFLWSIPFIAYLWAPLNTVMQIVVILIVALLFPKKTREIAEKLEFEPGRCLLYGILGTVLIIPVALVLTISIVGIPLLLVEAGLILAAVLMGYAGIYLLLGRKVTTEAKFLTNASTAVQILIGALIIALVYMVPFFKFMVMLAIFTFGFGAALMVFMAGRKKQIQPASAAPAAIIEAPPTPEEKQDEAK